MNNRDFYYWLQGYFEIQSVIKLGLNLHPNQINCIKDHLKLIEGDLDDFTGWLQGVLDIWTSNTYEEDLDKHNENLTKLVREKLDSKFQHMTNTLTANSIDPLRVQPAALGSPDRRIKC